MVEESLRREKVAKKYADLGGSSSNFTSPKNNPWRSVQILTSYSTSFSFINYIFVNKHSLHLLHLQNSNELPPSDTRDWWSIVIEPNNFTRFLLPIITRTILAFLRYYLKLLPTLPNCRQRRKRAFFWNYILEILQKTPHLVRHTS